MFHGCTIWRRLSIRNVFSSAHSSSWGGSVPSCHYREHRTSGLISSHQASSDTSTVYKYRCRQSLLSMMSGHCGTARHQRVPETNSKCQTIGEHSRKKLCRISFACGMASYGAHNARKRFPINCILARTKIDTSQNKKTSLGANIQNQSVQLADQRGAI